jgi:lysophospholipase L1-like esterase
MNWFTTLRNVAALPSALAVLLLTLTPGVGTAQSAASPGYVAVGDSIDYGVASTPEDQHPGWVVPFNTYLETALGGSVELHDLAVPGATTKDINLEQLPTALDHVGLHGAFGVVVSYGGGGNDLRHFIESPQAAACQQTPSCLGRINALLDEAEQRVNRALAALRAAAGPSAPILVRTQYNALRRSGCATPDRVVLADLALEGGAGVLQRGLNDRLRDAAASHGAKVIEIFIPFYVMPDALIGDDCIHPNDTGYAVIVGAAIAAVTAP